MPILVLIHGLPLCLKSTLAADLAGLLQCGLVSTGFFGRAAYGGTPTEFDASRDRRYELCAKITKAYLKEGLSVIVEGNFSQPRWRRPILYLARSYNIAVTVVRCYCSIPAQLEVRVESRRRNPFALDRHAHANAYELEAKREVDIDKSELEGLVRLLQVHIDTCTYKLTVLGNKGGVGSNISEVLEFWTSYQRKRHGERANGRDKSAFRC